ncbi:MAG: NDP-sugar pyrophosphorylase family protein [Candidatus Azotimanducaceae bacterium]|jgi:NDP-sugar pyrophosphorylase family protein
MKDVKAIILAGGKGTRLRPLTAVFPKPLVPVGDKPIIEILLTRLKNTGLEEIVVSTGYLAELMMAVCGDGSKYGLSISYVNEDSPLGTAGSLGLVPDLSDTFIVMNGDLLTTLNFKKMIEFHKENEADVTIGTYQREVKIDFGVVDMGADGAFEGFREKPVFHYDVSMGVNVLSKRVMKHVAEGQYLDMPDLILNVHKDGGRVCCYKEDCYWLDIGRLDDYAQAQQDYEANEAKFLKA